MGETVRMRTPTSACGPLVLRASAALAALLVLALLGPLAPAVAQAPGSPPTEHEALTILPPGQSGFVSVRGQAQGQVTGDPADYGAHLDDQREDYWGFAYKDGSFHADGEAVEPKPGVRIHRDPFGVPSVHAEDGRDVWWGVGYAIAQDRLFLMDAVRRMGRGTFAELTGPSGVPADIEARVLTYSDEEYLGFLAAMSDEARDSIEGYVEGVNAWRDEVLADPDLLPAEYVLLSTLPAEWDVIDIMAGGVLITRTVAAEGGNEMGNVALLRDLEDAYGREEGRGVFLDLIWDADEEAVTTVPAADRFTGNAPTPIEQRRAVFDAMADLALEIPEELAEGPGTGAAPEPDVPDAPGDLDPAAAAAAATAVQALDEFRAALSGGSLMFAVDGSRTATGAPMLVNGPQLGYSYPSLLVELEVHGGGYDARGFSVPGLPTVGGGYGKRIAWGLTTGYSKTIDSFIETTRPADGDSPPRYLHGGEWKDQDCRTEVVRYRPGTQGLPAGEPLLSTEVEVCRTVHGPVVATTEDGTAARSVSYAMFHRELDTLEGILQWNRAQTLEEFAAGVAAVSWNENVMYADADGNIAYWHPGRYPRRAPTGDQRLPLPGTGEHDHLGELPFDQMPHSINPDQGWLANWNNKPAHGWLDGEGISSTSRPGGPGERVTALVDQLADARDLTFTDVQEIEQRAGVVDIRAREYLPLILGLQGAEGLSEQERAALDLLAGWDGSHFGPGADTDAEQRTDGPAPTVFAAVVEAIRTELFADLPDALVERQSGVGSHVFDMSAADNLAVRVLDPASSSLTPSRDYTGGRGGDAVLRAALAGALEALAVEHGSDDLADYRREHPRSDVCSLTGGVIGPCLTMPYQDRGSWIHLVAFDGEEAAPQEPAPQPTPQATSPPAAPAPPVEPSRGLPATGGGALALGLLVLLSGALLRPGRAVGRASRRAGGGRE
jgi:penicillin G amidase